mgnify:CR=1 FL=1
MTRQFQPGGVGPKIQLAYNTRNVPTNLYAPMQMPTPTNPMPSGLLGPNPADAKAQAFLQGIGAMAPGLLMAGAPSLDPGNRQRGYAMAFQGLQQGQQGALDRVRAQNLQELQFKQAQAKLAADKMAVQNKLNQQRMLRKIFPQLNRSTNQAANNQFASTAPTSSVLGGNAQSSQPMPVQTAKSASQAVAPQQTTVNFQGVDIPQSVIAGAMLTPEPGKEISKFVQGATSPTLKFRNGTLTPLGRREDEDKLRDTLKIPLKEITNLDKRERSIMAALDLNTGLGDLAAINTYQRLIDDAVVRGEDVELIRSAQSYMGRLITFSEQVKSGKLLNNTQKSELRNAANSFVGAIKQGFVGQLTNVKKLAIADKLRWDRIWMGPSLESLSGTKKPKTKQPQNKVPLPPTKKNAPKIGSKESGYFLPSQGN